MFIESSNHTFCLKKITLPLIGWVCLISFHSLAQGLVNHGANIVLTGATQLYIDGTDGHYTSQASGSVTPASASIITLEGNWMNNSPNTAFSIDAGTVLLAGATQTIGGSSPTAFYNLSLAGNDIKTLAINSTTVGGKSSFSGILSLGSSTLDLNSNRLDITNSASGAITRSSGYIISETSSAINPSIIRWYHRTVGGSKIYPFGVDGSYIPFTLNITTTMTNTTGYVDVSTRSTPSDNTPLAGISDVAAVTHMYSPNNPYNNGSIPAVIDRWWNIENSDPITANLTFSYRGSENTLDPMYSAGFLGAQYWDGTAWLPDNATIGTAGAVTSGIGTVSASSISKFCPWILSAVLSPLPVELINFEANCIDNNISLKWCTASEKNNNYFSIEKSMNNIDFQMLGKVYGNGTTPSENCYQFVTPASSSEINYFRLSQTDNDKRNKVLKTIAIETCEANTGHILITNNGSRKIGVLLNSTSDQKIEIQIHNTLGQLIEVKEVETFKGSNNISIELFNVSSELYYVSVFHSSEKLISKKVVITDLNN